MIDPIIVHELIFGEVEWPPQIYMSSDVAKLNWYARENNVSIEDLKIALENFRDRYQAKTEEEKKEHGSASWAWAIHVWSDTAKKAIDQKQRLVGNLKVLDTKLTGTGDHEYGATISLRKDKYTPEGKYVVSIVQKLTDDKNGTMTGIPNAEYWAGTPGQYYASTILGWDKNSRRGGDGLCIDGGQNWCVYGMNALRDEIEEKYGDKIKNHMTESIRAKKVYENENIKMKAKLLTEGFATEEGRKLDSIASLLGYDDLHEMLGDNPGLFEACINWIDETFGDQLAEEHMNPDYLESLGLYNAAELSREYDDDEDED